MKWEVRISYKKGVQDSEGESTLYGLRVLGFEALEHVGTSKVYTIDGDIDYEDVEKMCKRLLANPVSQDYNITQIEKK